MSSRTPFGEMDSATVEDATGAASQKPTDARVHLMLRWDDKVDLVSLAAGENLVVGRASDAGYPVDDSRVSRLHARLENKKGELSVRDLGSRNGTKLNGRPLDGERVALAGDVIGVGPLEIVVAATPAPLAGRRLEAEAPAEIVVADPAMRELFATVERLAKVPTSVLILGETGTGKEVVAELLHRRSPRANAPFVRINCASLPESLLESELFGHEKGAFTGANQRKIGHLEAANTGTLFLDEIGELPLQMQAKLLRVLESRRMLRVGGREEVELDVRIVSATNKDLASEIGKGTFRDDLYYRVNGFSLKLPPLRERPSEIALLARHFSERFAQLAGATASPIGAQAQALLERYPWPGNARELRNAIEHAQVLADGKPIQPEHLPESVRVGRVARAEVPAGGGQIRDRVAELEKQSIEEALAACGGNQRLAAERLGISRRALVYKLSKYDIKR